MAKAVPVASDIGDGKGINSTPTQDKEAAVDRPQKTQPGGKVQITGPQGKTVKGG